MFVVDRSRAGEELWLGAGEKNCGSALNQPAIYFLSSTPNKEFVIIISPLFFKYT